MLDAPNHQSKVMTFAAVVIIASNPSHTNESAANGETGVPLYETWSMDSTKGDIFERGYPWTFKKGILHIFLIEGV